VPAGGDDGKQDCFPRRHQMRVLDLDGREVQSIWIEIVVNLRAGW
jgi:hypothetical protein